jgi:hypothetical protein
MDRIAHEAEAGLARSAKQALRAAQPVCVWGDESDWEVGKYYPQV